MSNCDGRFEPKPTAPPNWVLTPENLYNGKLLDLFAGVYAAKELAGQTQPGDQNQEWTTRKNKWIDFLNRLKNPPNQNTRIIDLGLVPDLCHQGRPPDPAIPPLNPEALANGSVGNAVAELYKQQLFDQWCECKPRDRPSETCSCQWYRIRIRQQIMRPAPQSPVEFSINLRGKITGIQTASGIPGGPPGGIAIGLYHGLGCPEVNNGSGDFFSVVGPAPAIDVQRFDVTILDVQLAPGFPVVNCSPAPPPPPPTPYTPGLPPGFDIALPPELPKTPPETWDDPGWFIPVRSPFGTPVFPQECPPSEKCDYMYWTISRTAESVFYSDTPPASGVVVFGTSDTVDFDITFAIANALADQSLRSWRKRTQPIDVDTTFINVCNVWLMIDGVAIGDGEEMNVPRMRMHVPFEYRDRQKAVKIMPKGVNTPIVVSDSGNRWTARKFPTT